MLFGILTFLQFKLTLINGFTTYREDSLTSRPPIAPFNENRLGWDNKKALGNSKGVGIIMSDGDYWRDQVRGEQFHSFKIIELFLYILPDVPLIVHFFDRGGLR